MVGVRFTLGQRPRRRRVGFAPFCPRQLWYRACESLSEGAAVGQCVGKSQPVGKCRAVLESGEELFAGPVDPGFEGAVPDRSPLCHLRKEGGDA